MAACSAAVEFSLSRATAAMVEAATEPLMNWRRFIFCSGLGTDISARIFPRKRNTSFRKKRNKVLGSNIQHPTSREDPSLKVQLTNKRRETFGDWILMLRWMLDVGAGPRRPSSLTGYIPIQNVLDNSFALEDNILYEKLLLAPSFPFLRH